MRTRRESKPPRHMSIVCFTKRRMPSAVAEPGPDASVWRALTRPAPCVNVLPAHAAPFVQKLGQQTGLSLQYWQATQRNASD